MVYIKVDSFLGTDIVVDTGNSKFHAQPEGYNRIEERTIAAVRLAMSQRLPAITLTKIEDDRYRDLRVHQHTYAGYSAEKNQALYPERDGRGLTGHTRGDRLTLLYEPDADRAQKLQLVRDNYDAEVDKLKDARMTQLLTIMAGYQPVTPERLQELLAAAKEARDAGH